MHLDDVENFEYPQEMDRQERIDFAVKMARHHTRMSIDGGEDMNEDDIAQVLKKLEGSKVTEATIQDIPLRENGGRILADFLDAHPEMTALEITDSSIGEEGLIALAPAIGRHPNLFDFRAGNSSTTEKGLEAFFHKDNFNRNLGVLHLYEDNSDKINSAFMRHILKANSKNLVDVQCQSVEIYELSEVNQQRFYELAQGFPDTGAKDLNASQVRGLYERQGTFDKDYWDSARYGTDLKPLDNITAKTDFLNLLDSLPALGKPEDLFTSNETGFAPLDNPRAWEGKTIEDFKAIPLTAEVLEKRTDKGSSLLDSALHGLPAGEVVAHMNRQGVQLRGDALLNAEGKPSKILENLLDDKVLEAVFTVDNWLGASKQELQRVHQALPEAQRGKIGINALSQQISTSNQARGR